MSSRLPCIHVESNDRGLHEVHYMGMHDGDKNVAYGEGTTLDEAKQALGKQLAEFDPGKLVEPGSPPPAPESDSVRVEADARIRRERELIMADPANALDIRVTVPNQKGLEKELARRKANCSR